MSTIEAAPSPVAGAPASHWRRLVRHPDFPSFVLGVALAIAVCYPFFGSGRLFLLDWVVGPRTPILSPTIYGLNGGLTTGALDDVVVGILNSFFGAASTWLPIVAFFPLAAVGISRLTEHSRVARLSASALYCVNPFVFNRLYVGHIPLLIGYALVPFATRSTVASITARYGRWPIVAAWWTILTALSPQYLWIFGVVVSCSAIFGIRRVGIARSATWISLNIALLIILNLYIIIPHLLTRLPISAGQSNLNLFLTTPDQHLGLYFNVAAMYGFWRIGPGPVLPKQVVAAWPFLAIIIIGLVILGGLSLIHRTGLTTRATVSTEADFDLHEQRNSYKKRNSNQVDTGLILICSAFIGFLLTLGTQGPTGYLFRLAYNRVPFFDILREPQKAAILLVLAYSPLFGYGVESASTKLRVPRDISGRFATILLGICLPVIYVPTMFNGLDGQLSTSTIPAPYQQVESYLQHRSGYLLDLPWHLYMSYPFTDNRVIANIAPTLFSVATVSGNNIQTGNTQSQSLSSLPNAVARLIEIPKTHQHISARLWELGIRFVLLDKTVDWKYYDWLDTTLGITKVIESPTCNLYELMPPASTPSNYLIMTQLPSDSVSNSRKDMRSPQVARHSMFSYTITTDHVQDVQFNLSYQPGWFLNGAPTTRTPAGAILLRLHRGRNTLVFIPAKAATILELTSLIILAMIILYLYYFKLHSIGD